jgi:Holliday junction resolvase RusA-like endonuclease
MNAKLTEFYILPSTHVRSTQGDRWLFSVTEEYLAEYDRKRLETHGKPGRTLDRRRQLDKYNSYKEELRHLVEKQNFAMPLGYFVITFHIPFPPSWRKKKRLEMDGVEHQSTPDLDNLIKAFFDGVMPRRNRIAGGIGADDRKVHCYAAFKKWCQPGRERIEILEFSKSDFLRSLTPSNYTLL